MMRSRFELRRISRVTLFLLCFVLSVIATGCGNNCFGGFFNPYNNTPGVPTSNLTFTCSQLRPTTAVKTVAHLVQACADCFDSRQITHLHLLLSGIELHPSAVADENSPEWQELAPDWARHPQWVDLVEDAAAKDAVLSPIVTGQIPAGTYYLLRLHLAQQLPQHVEKMDTENPCSSTDAGCVVTADGGLHSLQMFDGHPYLRVEATSPIELRSDQPNLLRIELRPEWGLQVSSTGVLDVLPLLRGRVLVESIPATDSL